MENGPSEKWRCLALLVHCGIVGVLGERKCWEYVGGDGGTVVERLCNDGTKQARAVSVSLYRRGAAIISAAWNVKKYILVGINSIVRARERASEREFKAKAREKVRFACIRAGAGTKRANGVFLTERKHLGSASLTPYPNPASQPASPPARQPSRPCTAS